VIPGGIRVRLALGVAAIVAGALGTAYLIVVPSLERDLVDDRLDQLVRQAMPLADQLPEDRFQWPDELDRFSVTTNARVIVFEVLKRDPPALTAIADSRRRGSRDVTNDMVARDAVTSGKVERGRVLDTNGDFGDVAVPVDPDTILFFRASLEDSLATVRLVQRRLLLATVFALALALVLGLTAAGMLAHRLQRLESAAERIAGGHFDQPIVDRGNDEIGQLAVAFDRMRVRLARLDNARKEFVANASHELRTPLFSLGGFLELLADEDLDEETRREFLATMQGQMERLTKLSTDLLDLSRVDAGQLNVAAEPVDLGEVVRFLTGEFEHVAAASDHVLEADATADVWSAADEERVVQVGRALLMNALVHTPEGTRITIGARGRGDRAELYVEDDGPGIPREHQEAVFERFYRVDDSSVASGSGLGLAIARELARLMGGSVRLESQPGRTEVVLELPSETPPDALPIVAPAFSRENGDTD
jgi:signal transduction histidine kinase